MVKGIPRCPPDVPPDVQDVHKCLCVTCAEVKWCSVRLSYPLPYELRSRVTCS